MPQSDRREAATASGSHARAERLSLGAGQHRAIQPGGAGNERGQEAGKMFCVSFRLVGNSTSGFDPLVAFSGLSGRRVNSISFAFFFRSTRWWTKIQKNLSFSFCLGFCVHSARRNIEFEASLSCTESLAVLFPSFLFQSYRRWRVVPRLGLPPLPARSLRSL